MSMVRAITLWVLLLMPAAALAVPPWVAEKPQAWQVKNSKFELSLKGGGSMFFHGQKSIKANARLEVGYLLNEDTSIGLEGLGMVTGNNDYQLLAGYLVLRAYMINEDSLRVWLKSGLGGGPGPPTLNMDGKTRHDVAGLVQLGVGLSYAPWNHRVAFGVELIEENLSMVSLLATLGVRL